MQAVGFSLQGRHTRIATPSSATSTGCVGEHVAAGQPVISVDTKKKELVGEFKNGGREYQPRGTSVPTNVHDSMTKELGKAIRYGIFDVIANTGRVCRWAPTTTPRAFAVQTLRRWRDTVGCRRYPHADRLLICADGGGSNGYRIRAPGRSSWPSSPPKPGSRSPSAICPRAVNGPRSSTGCSPKSP